MDSGCFPLLEFNTCRTYNGSVISQSVVFTVIVKQVHNYLLSGSFQFCTSLVDIPFAPRTKVKDSCPYLEIKDGHLY